MVREHIDKWFAEHTGEMLADLAKLIEIDSVRGPSADGAPYGEKSRQALRLVQDMLEKRGFDVRVFKDMVISSDFGALPPRLGILAHVDVVEAGEGWETDPYKLTQKDGCLYARGIIDNKGPAMAAMYAVYCIKELFPDMENGVQLILGSGEEVGCDDIGEYIKHNETPPYLFSPDSEFPVVNIEKGRLLINFGAKWEKDMSLPRVVSITGGKVANIVPNYATAVIEGISKTDAASYCKEFSQKTGVEIAISHDDYDTSNADHDAPRPERCVLIAKGTASHASRPDLGNNAQTALLAMLCAMPFAQSKGFGYICALNRLFPHKDTGGKSLGIYMQDEESGKMTVNFGVLRYDEYEFSGNFDSRSPICADEVDLLAIAEKAFGREAIEITYHDLKKSHHTAGSSPFVQTLLRIYEEYTGNTGECICIGGHTYVHGIPGGVAFGCAMPGVDNKAHGAGEFIALDHLVMSAKMFARVIIEICGSEE
ncbi:MAG: Sapep family Mn(2+)-dependent dipeptidase [Oscillospiraceae bacterium]|nr:Sapep family Mn(2+)-dependent dipeptidase [Oscillospiraceae bacterium]